MGTYPSAPRGINAEDFVESHYREILELVNKSERRSVGYGSIPWGESYLLWRHDIDFSINRSYRLAQINLEHSVHSTFFVNIHSTFYNAFEASQTRLLREIVLMGHDIGIHFDGDFYGDVSEGDLERLIAREAALVSDLVEGLPVAVSFHNPTDTTLRLDKLHLGELVNAYSRRLMDEAFYCSDSNGYWRFERLADVVADGSIDRLQVLTHPGLWQKAQMSPRDRVWRSALGRASATIDGYDRLLRDNGRKNFGG